MRITVRLPQPVPLPADVTRRGLVISAGGHGAVALLLAVIATLPVTRPVPPGIYTVSIVSDLPSDGQAPGSAQAPHRGAAASAAPPPQASTPDRERTAPPSQHAPSPGRQEPPKPSPQPARHDQPATPPAAAPASDEPAKGQGPPSPEPSREAEAGFAPTAAGAAGGLPTIDSLAFPFPYYREVLTNRLRYVWSRPLVPAELTQPIRATIHFEIQRGGAITAVAVAEASGHPPLDRSALRAVYDANPMPPLPEEFSGDQLAVNFYFELTPAR